MAKKIWSVILRYGLALGIFAVILGTSLLLQQFSIKINLTILIVGGIIAAAWYGGMGPGILLALLIEGTTILYTPIPPDSSVGKAWFGYISVLLLLIFLAVLISSRKNAEKRLREQGELLQVTLESIGDAVIATDIDGKINFINSTAEKMTGWTLEEAAGRPLEEVFQIVNEETHEAVESPFAIIKREGVTVGLANHTALISKDGREIPIEDSGAPIRDDEGRIIGTILVFHDVSERRASERERERLFKSEKAARGEAESANRLKDEFLATVSHELRTPLNAILGWASMLNRGNLKEENVRNALEIIERNAKAQAEIIGDILDVSRIITGKLQIESKPVELASVIQSAVDTLYPAADAKSINFTVSLDENAGLVTGDADRLQQVIWNLVSNAIKFTPAGGQIEVRLKQADSHAEISVSDTGIGITEKFLPFVFERFRQADSSTTRADSGLGLGLAIVRHLVELHGGTVRAESEGAGKGATFTIKLPLTATGENLAAADKTSYSLNPSKETRGAAAQALDLKGLRVLVVDDDPDTLEVLHLMLSQYGAEVRTAVSSAAALETFLDWKPAVLVSDIGMPNEDGYSLIGKIRGLSAEQGGNTPAAALTAYVRERDKRQAINAGFQIHIAKPVEQAALAEAVAKLARKRN
jgi:PAS domain S-box-containing protein